MSPGPHTGKANTREARARSRVRQPARRFGLSSEADPRSLLQSRLALFHLVIFGLTGVLFAVSLLFVVAMESVEYDRATTFSLVAHAGITIVTGGSWLFLRSRPLGTGALGTIDALVAGFVGLMAACWAALIPPAYRPELAMLLAMTQVLFGRASLVPSDPARTAAVGAAVMVPVVIGVYYSYTLGPTPAWLQPASGPPTVALVWSILIVVLSSLTSRVIYGLRRKVEEAMQLGQYTVERLLGKGGMGAVYLARHALMRRPTALKVLEAEAAGAEAIARFEREVQATSELTHPNTVAIYDYGRTPDASFYYAMEYLDGFDLEALVVADGPQPPGRVVNILRQVCGALGEAHSRGLVHRDVKPANVMLCERGRRVDFVKVLDFGLVRDRETGAELSREQVVRGTPLYMAPEAITSPADLDARADIYAVGGVAYYLLTGHPPFERGSAIEVMAAQVRDVPEPPSLRAGRSIPAGLEQLVLACLEKLPARRPATMDDLLGSLERLEDLEPWTDAAARAWWQEHAQRLRSDGKSAGSPSDRPPTVAIDLAHHRKVSGMESTQIARGGLV